MFEKLLIQGGHKGRGGHKIRGGHKGRPTYFLFCILFRKGFGLGGATLVVAQLLRVQYADSHFFYLGLRRRALSAHIKQMCHSTTQCVV